MWLCYHAWVRKLNPDCVDGTTPASPCPHFDAVFNNFSSSLEDLQRFATQRPARADEAAPLLVYAVLPERWVAPAPHHPATSLKERSTGARLFSPALFALLRAPLWTRPLRFEHAARPALAMHVRRGDLATTSE